jgi:hypothetical protein
MDACAASSPRSDVAGVPIDRFPAQLALDSMHAHYAAAAERHPAPALPLPAPAATPQTHEASDAESDEEEISLWSGSDDDDFSDSDEDTGARVSRKMVQELSAVAVAAERATVDERTGEARVHRSLSVRSACTVRNSEKLNPSTVPVLSESDAQDILNQLNFAARQRDSQTREEKAKRPWFLSKPFGDKLSDLPDWDRYKAASPEERLQMDAGNGRPAWTSAPMIIKHWAEYSGCCGMKNTRTLVRVANSTVGSRCAHSAWSIQNFMAKRIKEREAHSSKKSFTEKVSQRLENSVIQAEANGEKVAFVTWDEGEICHSCYRALLGLSRSAMFVYSGKQRMRAHVLTLKKAAQEDPKHKGIPRLLALAETQLLKQVTAAARPIKSFSLTKALLLDYCREHGQHDPAAAGSTSITHTIYSLPQHGIGGLTSALNIDLASRITLQRPLSDCSVRLPPAGDPKEALQVITRSTLRRVIQHLKTKCHVRIQLVKQKGVCRCTHCDELTERIKNSAHGSLQRHLIELEMADHIETANQQRKFFDAKKAEAMKNPCELWCITFDGFDQSKTRLPHRPRLSKELEKQKKNMIGVHVVGVFAFGAPLPVMAFFNDDTVTKDGNLSATIVYEVLEKQWQHFVDDYLGKRAGLRQSKGVIGTEVDAEELSQAYAFAASKWPRRLHLTYDNATGEAKNQTFFRAMAMLVHFGIFEAITMSTLLVGHTHDIVDQMFR